MHTFAAFDTLQPESPLSLDDAFAASCSTHDGITGEWGPFRLRSHFQPIMSFSHRAVVGQEGLVRARDGEGAPVAPPVLLRHAAEAGKLVDLDRLCRFLHLSQAARLGLDGYIFLNMHPLAFSRMGASDCAGFMRDVLAHLNIPANHIVIEVTEDVLQDESSFESNVNCMREIGCQIAIDDFGAGHSNFNRVWRLRPEIVKLDRDFAVRAEQSPDGRRLLPQIVELLHEAGSLVLLEGIETQEQARLAMAADVDFAQGYFFSRPQPDCSGYENAVEAIDATWKNYDTAQEDLSGQFRRSIQGYIAALSDAARLLVEGQPIARAIQPFLTLGQAMRCYLLDDKGFQLTRNIAAHAHDLPTNFLPSLDSTRARWSHRPYFRRALESPGRVCVTRPYLCITSAVLCLTVSISLEVDGELRVLCGDIAWQ